MEYALVGLQQEAEFAIEDVRRGEPVTTDHTEMLRECLSGFEHTVEAHLAALVDDAEPWWVEGPAWVEGGRSLRSHLD